MPCREPLGKGKESALDFPFIPGPADKRQSIGQSCKKNHLEIVHSFGGGEEMAEGTTRNRSDFLRVRLNVKRLKLTVVTKCSSKGE